MLGLPGWGGIRSRGLPGWGGIRSSAWGRILSLPGGVHRDRIRSSGWGRILSLPGGLHGIRSSGWTGMLSLPGGLHRDRICSRGWPWMLSLPSLARIRTHTSQAKQRTLLQAISEASTGVIGKSLEKLHDLGV